MAKKHLFINQLLIFQVNSMRIIEQDLNIDHIIQISVYIFKHISTFEGYLIPKQYM